MGRKRSNTAASTRVPARRAPKTLPRNVTSSPSSSPPQNVAQPAQPTIQSVFATVSTPAGDWASLIGLDQSDIDRASISSFSTPQHNTNASQQTLQLKKPASIMTSIHGVPLYSHETRTSAQPFPSKNSSSAIDKILLPRLDPTLRYYPPAYPSSSLTKPLAPLSLQHPSADLNTPQEPPSFDPAKCHWRALRDVAFILDGCMDLSLEDLCALLCFRYAKDDAQMEGVEVHHVAVMYEFCQGWPKEMYEKTAGSLIRLQMGSDLKLMRDGGVAVVSGDF